MDPLWSKTFWSTFKYFIILFVSTYCILCISWIIKCLIQQDCLLKSYWFTGTVFLISFVDDHWYLVHTSTFEDSMCQFHNCNTFGNRESYFYEDCSLKARTPTPGTQEWSKCYESSMRMHHFCKISSQLEQTACYGLLLVHHPVVHVNTQWDIPHQD